MSDLELFDWLCQKRQVGYSEQQRRQLGQFIVYMARHSYWLCDIWKQGDEWIFRFSDEASHLDLTELEVWSLLAQLKQGKSLPWEQLVERTKQKGF